LSFLLEQRNEEKVAYKSHGFESVKSMIMSMRQNVRPICFLKLMEKNR